MMGFRWPYQYRVSGRGEFPWGTLIYDEADFATLVDEQNAGAGHTGRRRTIKVIGQVAPAEARWESFGWTVSHVEPLPRKPRAAQVKRVA